MRINTPPPAGGIFITDVVPTSTGTVANKVYQDTSVLVSCESDTTSVTVSVIALTGSSHLIPRATVNGVAVSNFALDSNKRWAGSVAITGAGTTITALHEDGGFYAATMTAAVGPALTAFNFSGGYPGSQTEVKLNDTLTLSWTADKAVTNIEVVNFEACQAKSQVVSGSSGTFTISVANRGAGTFANQRAKVRCQGTNGIWGDYVMTDAHGSGDGSAYVQLNNDVPVIAAIAQGNITYPASQAALKDSETATVACTITSPSGAFTAAYTSPNGDLSIASPSTYGATKTVTRISGNYNISTTNLQIVATKTTNAATATRTAVVYVAHTAHTIAITQPNARLRSSPTPGSDYVITITANQQLLNAPSLNALTSGQGTWQGAGFAGSGTTWTRTMRVVDSDSKGTFSYAGAVSTNLAGKVVNTINSGGSYVLGGFSLRTLTFAAWPNRESDIGTTVANTAKVRATNLQKYTAGTWNEIYENALTDHNNVNPDLNNYFTITSPTGVLNATGNLFRINDLAVVGNTSGLWTFECEEQV